MSAFIVGRPHIDALVVAAVYWDPADLAPLSWFSRELTDEEKAVAYQRGAPWGPQGPEIARVLRREATLREADRIGQMLARENRLSVNYRYGESEVEDLYTFEPPAMTVHVEPVVILKTIDCFEYQSCEHPGWEDSEAHAFCQALRRRMIRRLPGYAEAPWEIGQADYAAAIGINMVAGTGERKED